MFSCAIVDSISWTTFTFNCRGFVGRYVNIIIPGQDKILTLCEVDIIGSKLPYLHGAENVALGGRPTQSSTGEGAGAERANDGNSDSDFWHGSCARTKKSKDPWWRVDLKERYNVSDVKITNRGDCCSDQIQGAEIRIGDSLANNGNSNRFCATVESVSTTLSINCGGIVGRYVNIIIPGPDKILTLCEIEIFGSQLPSLPGTGRLNCPLRLWFHTISNFISAKFPLITAEVNCLPEAQCHLSQCPTLHQS
ncbi:fucolectin-like [Leucoraja erinacea]|uniref:fucolectin-like n=1 Tax=Leucoraja erinaceus TaxID=7782 RepID=UPI0024554C69|nr:fucolectin-like [Leucoraja erinacea]